MSTATSQNFDDIRAMLESGHHSVRLEKHSFVIWGMGAALLIGLVEFQARRFALPQLWQTALVTFGLLALGIALMASLDFSLTKRVRRSGDETVSFVQRQLTKLLWLIGLFIAALFLPFGLHGGGEIMYPFSMGLLGLFFFVAGLFSRQAVSWAGLLLVAACILCVSFVRSSDWWWMAIAVYGLGLPLLGMVLEQKSLLSSMRRQVIMTSGWLLVVFGAGFGGTRLWAATRFVAIPAGDPVPLSRYLAAPQNYARGEVVISLPVGTKVPVELTLSGNIIADKARTMLTLRTGKPVLVVLKDGRPDGRIKVGERRWEDGDTHHSWLYANRWETEFIEKKGPAARLSLKLRY